jgi:hypothetical protein
MADQGGYEHGGKWPRRLVPQDMHYIVHKVAEATVRDGAIMLTCAGDDGRSYGPGPYHPSVFKEHRRPIREHLGQWDMERVGEIGFVVAYHSGGFVNGMVVRLLRGEEDVEALVARVIEARAHLAKTDGPLSVIVSGWRRRRPPPRP